MFWSHLENISITCVSLLLNVLHRDKKNEIFSKNQIFADCEILNIFSTENVKCINNKWLFVFAPPIELSEEEGEGQDTSRVPTHIVQLS